ncbi:hypothetical protein MNBD_ALPHA11-1072, partial [hydrothermal vent metagenome]
ASTLGELRGAQHEIATSLSKMIKGLVAETDLM